MKRLLLLSLCVLPLTAMQDKPALLQEAKRQAAPIALVSGSSLVSSGIIAGGCIPHFSLIFSGAYAIKKAYDWRYKQEIFNEAKGK